MRTFALAMVLPIFGQDVRLTEKKLPVLFDHADLVKIVRAATPADFDIVVEITWDKKLEYRVNGKACVSDDVGDALRREAAKHPYYHGTLETFAFGEMSEEFELSVSGDRDSAGWRSGTRQWVAPEEFVAKGDPGKTATGILRFPGSVSWQDGASALYAAGLITRRYPGLKFEIETPKSVSPEGRAPSRRAFVGQGPALERYLRPKFVDPVVPEKEANYSGAIVLVSVGENVDASAFQQLLLKGAEQKLIHYAIEVDAGKDGMEVLPLDHLYLGVSCKIEVDGNVVIGPPRKQRPLPEMEKPRDIDPNKKILDEDPIFIPMEEDVEELIRKLSDPDFTVQGRAAEELAIRGLEAVPALEELLKSGTRELRGWAERILERIRTMDGRMRDLIPRLGDDATAKKAEEEIRAIGRAALSWLRTAAKSEDKNLQKRAKALLDELDDFVSDKPFKGKGINDEIGKSGRFRCRRGEKKRIVARGGGGADTEDAVLSALKWIARHQKSDGSWSAQSYVETCKGDKCTPNPAREEIQAGVTGLALLAFLGAGYTHLSVEKFDGIGFGELVKKALQWMMSHQDPEGCIGGRDDKYMYGHLLCAFALAEAYGLTGSNLFKDQAQKAVDFTVAAQNPGKGWRYSYRSAENDSSVTGWAALVLNAAKIAGLTYPKSAWEGARTWFDEVTEESYYRTGYTAKNTGKVYIPGQNENFNHHETLAAMAMTARIVHDKNGKDPRISGGAHLLVRDLPNWKDDDIDFYYWHHGSAALYQFNGPSGKDWIAWNRKLKDALIPNQNLRGCKAGSWEPVDRWSCEGGRVYATALNALTLETYYRYPRALEQK